jgi:hypothetical protein
MKTSVITITPDYARMLLSRNVKNRPVYDRKVNEYYLQMVNGFWMVSNDAISVGKDCLLKNGQHRLLALIKYGKPLEFLFIEGIENDAFKIMDTGKKRNASDALNLAGYVNSTKTAAAVRSIIMYESGGYQKGDRNGDKISNSEILVFVEKNPELNEIINYVSSIWKRFRFISLGNLTMLYWVLSKKNQLQADEFFEKYSTGIDLASHSPIRLLRERLLTDSVSKSKLPSREKIALFIFAWNAFLCKKPLSFIRLSKDYTFPKPIGTFNLRETLYGNQKQ